MEIAPYSIGYVGISFLNQANELGLGYAALQNPAKHFVLPTQAALSAAAEGTLPQIAEDERISLVDVSASAAYPIVNYEYAIVNERQDGGPKAEALRALLHWTISPQGGSQSQFLDPIHFVSLPVSIAEKSRKQIDAIQ